MEMSSAAAAAPPTREKFETFIFLLELLDAYFPLFSFITASSNAIVNIIGHPVESMKKKGARRREKGKKYRGVGRLLLNA